jgi:hypothetical protein
LAYDRLSLRAIRSSLHPLLLTTVRSCIIYCGERPTNFGRQLTYNHSRKI